MVMLALAFLLQRLGKTWGVGEPTGRFPSRGNHSPRSLGSHAEHAHVSNDSVQVGVPRAKRHHFCQPTTTSRGRVFVKEVPPTLYLEVVNSMTNFM